MNKPKIQVILGSIREGRAGEQVAQWAMEALKDNQNVELELVDLADYPMPLYADSNETKNRDGAHPDPVVQKWIEKISQADGYIIITAEYNHSYTSGLKNALDYADKALYEKPVGFIGYGGAAGGSRAIEHLRQVITELHMYSVRDQVVIPAIWAAFDEQGNLTNSQAYAKTANAIADKVSDLATKLRVIV